MATIRNMFTTSVAPLALIGLLAAPVMAQTEGSGASTSETETMPAKDGNTAGTSAAADDASNPEAPAASATTAAPETGTMGSGATTATPDTELMELAGLTVVSSDGAVLGTIDSAMAGTAGVMLIITPDAALGLTDTAASVSLEAEPMLDAEGRMPLPMTADEFTAAAAG